MFFKQRIKMPGRDMAVPPTLGGRIGRELHKGRWYEERMLRYIASLKIPGAYLDVGANVGNHSLFFALNTRASKVIAVEPSPDALEKIRAFAAMNQLEHKIKVLPYAAADRSEVVTVSLIDGGRSLELEGRRLDELVSEPIALIKMDIEGAEPAALRGAERILKASRPRLFIEAQEKQDVEAILAVIRPFGYRPTGQVFNASPTHEFAVI